MQFNRFFLPSFVVLAVSCCALFGAATSEAQLTIQTPAADGVTVPLAADYATEVLNDPWDMSQATDINNYVPSSDFVNFQNVSFSNGIFSATAKTSDPYFYLVSPPLSSSQPTGGRWGSDYPINTSRYHILSFKMYTDVASDLQIVWNMGNDYFGSFVITQPINVAPGWHVYTLDLNNLVAAPYASSTRRWNGGPVTGLRIDPTVASGATVKFDWIALQGETNSTDVQVQVSATASGGAAYYDLFLDDDQDPTNGYVRKITATHAASGNATFAVNTTGLPAGTYYVVGYLTNGTSTPAGPTVVGGTIRVNQSPLVTILQPDAEGGEGVKPWNMSSSADIWKSFNLSVSEFLPFAAVGGLTGDFFHGRNVDGNDDPVQYSAFHTANPAHIDAEVYHNLTYKLLVAGDCDLVGGSVARVNWAHTDDFGTSQDIVVFPGWNKYTVDLKTVQLEQNLVPWSGTINTFRVDAHEFSTPRDYWFDYIHVRADDRANSKFAITYNISDPDGDAADTTVSLYYVDHAATSGGTLIASFPLAQYDGMYVWDTSGVPEGTYYIYAVATDGYNETRRLSTGKLVVTRSWDDVTPPILSVDAPSANYLFDQFIQLKGYALDAVQLAELRVFLDGALVARIHPEGFNPTARAAYPNLVDSSNAGFNQLIDTTSVSAGAHTLTYRAIDTSGNVTEQTVQVTKQAGAAPTLIADPTPGSVTPDPTPQTGLTRPTLSGMTVSSAGALKTRIKQLTQGCTVKLISGASSTKMSTLIMKYTASAADASSGTLLNGTKLGGYNGKFYLKVTEECGASGSVSSNIIQVKFAKKSAASYNSLVSTLKKRLLRK